MSSKIQLPSIKPPTTSEKVGGYNDITYVRHQGQFVWENGVDRAQSFSVPYEITTPSDPTEGNRTFVFEPPHHTGGPVSRNAYLGPEFLFSQGFSHASVGYSNVRMRILNPKPGFPMKIKNVPITMIDFGQPGAVTDTNILSLFANALKQSSFLGPVERIYGIGFSDSGNTLHQVYQQVGHRLFDLSFACTANYLAPFPAQNPIIIFNTERDFDSRAIPDPQFPQYRWYAVAGAPHIPDAALTRPWFKDGTTPPIAGTTPLDWSPFIRALFVAGDQWVRQGTQPPASVTLMVNSQGLIARDVMCNALGGIRHPALENGEATFINSVVRPNLEPKFWENFGGYGSPKKKLTSSEFPQYLESFTTATEALVAARYLLPEDGELLIKGAEIQPPNTFTRNYMNGLFP